MGYRIFNRVILTALLFGLGSIFSLGNALAEEKTADEAFKPYCENRNTVIAGLAREYAEQPVSMGYTAQGTVIEILVSREGNWTMIETSLDGTTCLVANGDAWLDVNKSKKTDAISDTLLQ